MLLCAHKVLIQFNLYLWRIRKKVLQKIAWIRYWNSKTLVLSVNLALYFLNSIIVMRNLARLFPSLYVFRVLKLNFDRMTNGGWFLKSSPNIPLLSSIKVLYKWSANFASDELDKLVPPRSSDESKSNIVNGCKNM